MTEKTPFQVRCYQVLARPHQTAGDFEAELAALTEEDRRDLERWIGQADAPATKLVQDPAAPVGDDGA